MGFDDYKSQLESDDDQTDYSDEPEIESGDACPESECDQSVHEIRHPRSRSYLNTERHESFNEREYFCVHHGIVATV